MRRSDSEGAKPPRRTHVPGVPRPPLKRVVPVAREFEAHGHRCFITALVEWEDAFVVYYVEFGPLDPAVQEEEIRTIWRRKEIREALRKAREADRLDQERVLLEELRELTGERPLAQGALSGRWEARDDAGVSYRRKAARSTGDEGRWLEGRITFSPAFSSTARMLTLVPRDPEDRAVAEIEISLA